MINPEVFLHAAEYVAQRKRAHVHPTACAALAFLTQDEAERAKTFHLFADWFEPDPYRIYWFGRAEVFEPLKQTHPKEYRARVREVQRNRQARIYALLFMWAITSG